MNDRGSLRERRFWPIAIAMLCLFATLLVSSILQESQTWDEAAHLAAGYSYWTTRDFRLNPEHPPLSKLLAALPLLPLHPDFRFTPEEWRNADEYAIGAVFLYHNRVSADTLLFAGRAMTILTALALALVLGCWTRRQFGARAGLFSLLLFILDPNILAHGRYITSDMIVTAFLFCACIRWLGYLETGGLAALLQTGVLAGLTISSKFSGLIVYPLLLLLWIVYRRLGHRPVPRPGLRRQFLALGLLPFAITFALYFFDTRSLLSDPRLGPHIVQAKSAVRRIAAIPVPAYYYFRGLHVFIRNLHSGHETYFLGSISGRGSWAYFPVAFLLKTPVATLLLLLLCTALAIQRLHGNGPLPLSWLALGLPPLIYFLVSMNSLLNIGIRHILPVYPFLFVLIAAIVFGSSHEGHTRRVRAAGIVLGLLLVVECAGIYPNYLAFFNFFCGGPRNGPRYLLDSNLDWGQDLKNLQSWVATNRALPLCLCYRGTAEPEYYGLVYRRFDSARDLKEIANLDCVAAVSADYLFSGGERFQALRQRSPEARIGYSIYIYDLRKRRRGTG